MKRQNNKGEKRQLLDKLNLYNIAVKITQLDDKKSAPNTTKEDKISIIKEQIKLIKILIKKINFRKGYFIPLIICEGMLVGLGVTNGVISANEQEYLNTLISCVVSGVNFYVFKDVLFKEFILLNSTQKVFKQALNIAKNDLISISGNKDNNL